MHTLARLYLGAGDGCGVRPGVPHPGQGSELIGGALKSGALHVVLHGANTTELLTATGAAGAAMHQVGHGGAVAG